MIKLFKIFLFLFFLLIIAAAGFIFTFDANNYKAEIIEQVEAATGRDFDIAGKIKVSVFPWVGLKADQVTLGNAKGFSDNDFASISQLDIKVKLLPLLKRTMKVNKLRLHGLNVSLEVDKNGKNNWADLSQGEEGEEGDNDKSLEDAEDASDASAVAGIAIKGLELLDASIHWSNAKSKQQTTVTGLNLETGTIRFNEAVNVSVSAHVENNEPETKADIELSMKATFNEAFDEIQLDNIELVIKTLMQSVAPEPIELALNTTAAIDLKQQLIKLSQTKLSLLDVVVNADASITNLDTEPLVTGTLSSNTIDIRELMQRLQIELPIMAGENSLSTAKLSSSFNASASSAAFEKLRMEFDTSEITGWVRIPNLAKSNIRYQLVMDTIKLDDYMAPTVESKADENAESSSATDKTDSVADEDIVIALPLELLRSLDIDGVLTITDASFDDIKMSAVEIKTSAKNGLLALPLSMNLLDGQLLTKINLDVTSSPSYRLTINAKDLHAGSVVNPLLKDMFVNETIELKGKLNVNSNINTRGESLLALKKAAKGEFKINMNETVVTGVDIEYLTRGVVVDYMESKNLEIREGWRGEYVAAQTTTFTKVHASGNVADGKLNNKDLTMDSNTLKVTGKGHVDFVNNAMDYYAVVDLALERKQTLAEKLLDEPIGVHIHGPYETLAVDPDKKRIAKAVTTILTSAKKSEVKEKVEQKKEAVKQKTEEVKQKLQDKLKGKFKGLF